MTGGNFELRELEVIRGALNGVYYGPKVQVVVRASRQLLIWVPGHSAWSGTGCPWVYEPASLLITRGDRYQELGGGRLKAALQAQAERIDAEFGEGVSKLIEPGRTLVIG